MLKDFKRRQEEVLELIVRHYVDTAEPVSSRFVAKRLGLSSATIRNVMADLEDMGFIMHPHTSAGRVPTDRGYRYYIDSLMRVKNVDEGTIKSVKDEYGHLLRSLEDVLERTSHMISGLTSYVGLTLFSQNDKIYVDGASHIMEQPEFKDLKKLYMIMKCLEEKRAILNLLSSEVEDGRLSVHIGRENRSDYLYDCSIVTCGYKVKGKISGKIGVIGPKRMFYERVIPTLEFLAGTVTEVLENLETEER